VDGASHISARPERVLLVDDDQDILRFIEMLMRREGFRDISTADEGGEGLRLAMSLLSDLVLTNVQMARISGFEMVEKIRRDLTEPCIIFVTSKDGPGDRDTGLGVGGDGYITKPFDPDDFVHVVDRILAGTSERREGLADRRRASD